jgi:hypothetical protein
MSRITDLIQDFEKAEHNAKSILKTSVTVRLDKLQNAKLEAVAKEMEFRKSRIAEMFLIEAIEEAFNFLDLHVEELSLEETKPTISKKRGVKNV